MDIAINININGESFNWGNSGTEFLINLIDEMNKGEFIINLDEDI